MTFFISLYPQHHDYLIFCSGSPHYEYVGTTLHFKKDIMVFPILPDLLLLSNEGRWQQSKKHEEDIKQ